MKRTALTRRLSFKIFLLAFFVSTIRLAGFSQDFTSAGEYNNYILGDQVDIARRYLAYVSAVAHSNSMRRIDQKRSSLVGKIEQTQNKVMNAPLYKGDGQFRNAGIYFYKSLLRILNDDYGKMAQLEDEAQTSYENMEAYYNARNQAENKYRAASEKLTAAQKDFAKKYNIKLSDNTQFQNLDEMFKKVDDVNSYYEKLHLLFFKTYKAEGGMMEAIQSKDYSLAEKKRSQLSQFSKEGLAQTASVTAFNEDASLLNALKEYLQYCQGEADQHVPRLIAFPKKQAAFDKIRGDIDAIPKTERTQKDIDKYNNAVNDFNTTVEETNKVAERLSRDGQTYLNQWNKAVQSFMDKHVPHYEDEFEVG